jgi:predicted CoA-substrate-specific enzyme activase
VGIDAGAETIKLVVVHRSPDSRPEVVWRDLREHHKEPTRTLEQMLAALDWSTVTAAAGTGRLSRLTTLPRVPVKAAQVAGLRFRHPELETATVISIGSHGFSVLEVRDEDMQIFRENSRCSQGTGNFLRQLVERFDLTLDEAAQMAHTVDQPAPLSGRCPVILKTDMTHLANKGEERARILAGLYDAVCENVQVLIKPKLAPRDVVLVGGVTRAHRVREQFARYLQQHGMVLHGGDLEDSLFFEAIGAALLAINEVDRQPAARDVIAPPQPIALDRTPALKDALPRVQRMEAPATPTIDEARERSLILGFDIGSTGSKALAIDRASTEILWEGYLNTNGNPVAAAKQLMQMYTEAPVSRHDLAAVAVTGSGREIVGSLLSICFGPQRVYILNEIAAHAEGAMHYDPTVDTIFEIGGQDAKYIRLFDGRVTDAAMNEACSAGTGSFIEEQGKRFQGIRDVVHLGQVALTADCGISLGQHCSVFMAEVIDEAVAAGAPRASIIAGIYDSIIQNYLNRVKGSRDVGQRIFCQGMPFSADALAAAVARQTGSTVIIPPNPGTVGALGIALLARRHLALAEIEPLAAVDFLAAEVLGKDTFVCKSNKGCGGTGNKCRIDRLTTRVSGHKKRFLWGGSCSRYDRHTNKLKLPNRAPDPFRGREQLIDEVVSRTSGRRGRPTIGLTDEFTLKPIYPFFATFLYEMGFDLLHLRGADQSILKRGIEEANVPFCAPMQQYHGLMSTLSEQQPDYLFMPMLRSLPRVEDEKYAVLCPIVQASPDILTADLGAALRSRVLSPVVDVGRENLDSELFLASCARLADELGVEEARWQPAYQRARAAQQDFDEALLGLGREALAFCQEHDIIPVIVLGRAYTIYNTVLNSNVPALVREQGALPVPVDCYPIEDAPTFEDLYWGYAQRSLRAAHQIRRTPGQYAVYCSNYSCGPDSFNLHFFSYAMDGRPFAIIETDGHSGDAGTKTRIEAFLHCVHEERRAGAPGKTPRELLALVEDKQTLGQVREADELVLFPRMGPGAEVVAAAFRGMGIRAECLPMPDAEALELGRRNTSGKECVPMTITAGSLLQRLEAEPNPRERFCFFMPTANGPCRFGVYNLLHKIITERHGYQDRVRVFSASDDDYFAEVPAGFQIIVWAGFLGVDLLLEGFYHTRPAETEPGAAERIYERYYHRLITLMQEQCGGDLSLPRSLGEVVSGRLFGITRLVQRAAEEFARVCDLERSLPTVLVVGEIYVRCDPFANSHVIDKLEERGVRARFAPFNEWLEYTDWVGHLRYQEGWAPPDYQRFKAQLTTYVQTHIQDKLYRAMGDPLRWAPRTTVHDSLGAASDYLREQLTGEAVLTLGGPTHEHREGHIQGVVSVGPLECMPNKISETQFFHVAEREGLLSLTLPLNGEPFDIEVLEGFIYEVKERHRRLARRGALPRAHGATARPGASSRGATLAARAQRISAALGRGLQAAGVSPTLLEALIPQIKTSPSSSPAPSRPGASRRRPGIDGSRRRD